MSVAGLKYYLKKPKNIFDFFASRGLLSWMPDKAFLKIIYKLNTGKKLDLKEPKTFNEKLQWLKINDRKPEYTQMVDKYEAKKYVSEKIGEEHIIKTLGIWDTFDEIDFDTLPEQFVLKCTHDSGGLVICRDKSKLNINLSKTKINKSMQRNFYHLDREWPYKNVKHRIIAEEYMQDFNSEEGLTDYKFYCFDGEPQLLYVSRGLEKHSTATISFLTMDWQFAEFHRSDFKPFEQLPQKPESFEKMIDICRKLAKNHKFLRVDLYEINKKVYFSELTFTPCGGMMPFEPSEWDLRLGNLIKL